MLRVVVFDLGNVLIPWNLRFLYEKLIDDPDQLDYFLDNVLTLKVNAQLDRGRPINDVVAQLIVDHPQYEDLLLAFAHRWVETVGDPIEGSVAILHRLLDAGVACYALSNWGRDTFESVRHRFAFLDHFDGLVISGFEGVVKPEAKIFHIMCDRYRFRPDEALFIDDEATNIAAAAALGFAVHQFAEPAALAAHLDELNLLALT